MLPLVWATSLPMQLNRDWITGFQSLLLKATVQWSILAKRELLDIFARRECVGASTMSNHFKHLILTLPYFIFITLGSVATTVSLVVISILQTSKLRLREVKVNPARAWEDQDLSPDLLVSRSQHILQDALTTLNYLQDDLTTKWSGINCEIDTIIIFLLLTNFNRQQWNYLYFIGVKNKTQKVILS